MGHCRNTILRPKATGTSSRAILAALPIEWDVDFRWEQITIGRLMVRDGAPRLLTMRARSHLFRPHPEEPRSRGISKDGPQHGRFECQTANSRVIARSGATKQSRPSALGSPGLLRWRSQ